MKKRGRVYPPTEDRFWEKVDKTPGLGPDGDCWLWTGCVNHGGYGQMGRAKEEGGERVYTHRLSYELAYGVSLGAARRDSLLVLHRCDTPRCVNPDHLFLGTDKDNSSDKHAKSRARYGNQKGEANPHHILKDHQIPKIRKLALPQATIAELFGVSAAAIQRVKAGTTWSHIPIEGTST